ncbi:MAG: PAS domain S-box protein [bacterium]|nr:PAS domain S-box protein [bacterium]
MFDKEKFREIRKEKKISLSKLADIVGKTYFTLYRWEKGVHAPSDADIRLLANCLKVSVSLFSDLTEIEDINKDNLIIRNSELQKVISIDKAKYEVDRLVEEFGNIPSVNIQAIKNLKKNCNELRQKNEKLINKLSRYSHILDEAPIIIYVKDTNLKYVYANAAFFMLSNSIYDNSDIIGSTASDIFGLKEINKILECEKNVIKNKHSIYNYKVPIPGSNSKRIGLLNIAPHLSNKDTISYIVCTIRDITDNVSLSEILDINLNAMSYGICILKNTKNGEWKYVYRNKALEKITGYSNSEVFKMGYYRFIEETVHPSFHQTAKLSHTKKKFPVTSEIKIIRANGEEVWIESTKNYIRFNGEDCFIIVNRDINERKNQDNLNKLLATSINELSIGISVINSNTNGCYTCIYCNSVFKKIFGRPTSSNSMKLPFKNYLKNIYPEYKNKIKSLFKFNRKSDCMKIMVSLENAEKSPMVLLKKYKFYNDEDTYVFTIKEA